jgi:hypothetical protein
LNFDAEIGYRLLFAVGLHEAGECNCCSHFTPSFGW